MEEIMKKIEESAEDVPVPESLEPEQIKAKLQQMPKNKKRFSGWKKVEMAAAIALVVAVGGTGVYQLAQHSNRYESGEVAIDTEAEANDEESVKLNREKKEQIGSYVLAKSYEDVYESIAYVEESIDTVYDDGNNYTDSYENKEYMSAGAEEDMAAEESVETSDFSKTNTQVAGVDESDFVKNDGSYLYMQSQDMVSVVDIRKDKMKTVATIEPKLGASDVILDMYVDGDRVYLVVQKRETNLISNETDDDLAYGDVAYVNTESSTELLTYDVTGRTEGKLLGTVTVDGSYQTSRKADDYIYLFTFRYVGDRTEDETDGIIPQVNGKKMDSDCIYIQKDAEMEYIVVSINVNQPDETVDQLMLMNANMEVYMGLDAIYLYTGDYANDVSYTDITKFSYQEGYMDAVAATSVLGTIQDEFAISEEGGVLRVLTTEWSTKSQNQLYLLDDNLKLKGSLKNFATGEEIYAARYIGNIAYFITYHNTDPLFAVDISDVTAPKLLGQVEMTGFSDYLHPFGENLLLGVGYETDPDTSERLGVKLTMFDISDPVNLKIVDSVVMNGDFCEAASNYKCALVDADKNLIGFEVTDYSAAVYIKYMVYSWENDHFVKQMAEQSANWYDELSIRGLYAGSRFYLLGAEDDGYRIRSYDMDAEFGKVDELQLK
jgi:uncharacterized secreted protein with C-terminal beta-propeller domain